MEIINIYFGKCAVKWNMVYMIDSEGERNNLENELVLFEIVG